jgi:hypothetical protein
MATKDTAAKTPAAKPATKAAAKPATKPAAKKPAAEKKPRTRRTAAQIAEDKLKSEAAAGATGAQPKGPEPVQVKDGENLTDLAKLAAHRPQAGAMARPADKAAAEHNPALHHPTRAELGGYTALNEVNPKAETEALSNLHEVETAKLIVGQSLDALRTIEVAKGQIWTAENYHAGGSRNKSLVRWARYFGVEMTAMVWINGDVKAVTKAFDFNQKNGVYFPQHAHPFHYDVYDVDQPERYAGFNGILIQPFDFDSVEKKARDFQKASSFEATLELADRIAATLPVEELKRGDVLRSILNPEEHIIVLEVGVKNYFNERDYGYGGRGHNASPKGDLLALQLSFSKYDPFEPVRLDSYGSEPRYFHSTMFERVTRLKLDASNADFDADYLGGANLVK